LAAISLKIGIF